MKKYFIVILLLFTIAHAQPVKITGKIARWKGDPETHLTNLALVDISIKVAADGSFDKQIPQLNKGLYNLQGVGPVYLEPGYALDLHINSDSTKYVFTGKGSLENNLLLGAKGKIRNYFRMSDDGTLLNVTYAMSVENFLNTMSAYKKESYQLFDKSKSAFYKKLAKSDFDFYCLDYLFYYSLYYGVDSAKQVVFNNLLLTGAGKISPESLRVAYNATRSKVKTKEEKQLLDSLNYKTWDMNDSLLFVNSGNYRKLIDQKLSNLMYTDFRADFSARKNQFLIKLNAVQKTITNRFIRDYYAYSFTSDIIKMSKDSTLKDSMYRSFMAGSYDKSYKSKIADVFQNYVNMAPGKVSPVFVYTDVNGKKVSLSNLKGKYVYIDVWATWCAPCKKEIPFLTGIEEAYKERNIHFISLSVDVAGDKNTWKDYVKSNKLKGIQLMADKDFSSDFVKRYNINSIPRFILIDPDGKIVSGDALRPSDPALRKQLDKIL